LAEGNAMKAVYQAARGGLGGRRLQAVVIGLVVLACTAASTLALGMLINARVPFDHAFTAQHGADVTASVNTSAASAAELAATTRLPGVTGAAGPFPQTSVTVNVAIPGIPGVSGLTLPLTGRAAPGGPVDDLVLQAGSWPTSDDQVVWADKGPLSGVIQVGAQVTVTGLHAAGAVLTVVGIADSVTGTGQAWVLPAEVGALQRAGAPAGESEMLYRFASAATAAQLGSDVSRVAAALPSGAVLAHTDYLTVQQSESDNIAPWVPFIVTFGIIALVMSVLIVVNVVSGAVVAGTTRIGVLKSIGFTPAQVVSTYVLQVAVPAVVGCIAGVVIGNLLAAPLLHQNAAVYQVGALRVPLWVDVTVPLAILALTCVAAVLPALRAGRMSAVQAIATGRAPRVAHGYLAHRVLGRWHWLPRAVTIGFAAPFARPARTLVTAAAVLFGAVAVTFGAGLAVSLHKAQADISLSATEPVQVSYAPTPGGPGGSGGPGVVRRGRPGNGGPLGNGSGMTAAQRQTVVSALSSSPGTLHYVAETDDQLSMSGLPSPLSITAYDGDDTSWLGYALISGRWYSGPGQADVNTSFLTATGTSVGDTYTLTSGGRSVTVRIVGEVFVPSADLDMYLSSSTLAALAPSLSPDQYDVGLRPAVDPQAYANTLGATLGPSYLVGVTNSGSKVFGAVLTLVTLLTILLIAVAGLGVLNTVVLQLRERVHDLGVFKAVGMTPRQAIAMVVCSVFAVGLVAGVIAVPLGILVHHRIVPVMAHAAHSNLPSSLLSVYQPWELVLLALAGLVIAIVGALGPASWAARTRTAFALRAE
jgi:putative ABC transport system permease protein